MSADGSPWTRLWRDNLPASTPRRSCSSKALAISKSDPEVTKFLVTIDRDCRTIFGVDRIKGTCEPIAEIEQRLERTLEGTLTDDARKWNRGLKTIRHVPGGYILCDIFGIYRLNLDFSIKQYLSIPHFTDIHSALPYGDTLLVSNTGVDEVLWVDWQGKVLEVIDLHRWFPATPWMAHDLAYVEEQFKGDLRCMPLDWARESCHVNWAEQTPLGTMLSCFIQGEIIFFEGGRPVRRVPASKKCHAPRYFEDTGTILVSASEENRIIEMDLSGRVVWSMEGFQFAKHAERLSNGNLIVADTGNRRIAEVSRKDRAIVWECAVPGTPYDVEPWRVEKNAGVDRQSGKNA